MFEDVVRKVVKAWGGGYFLLLYSDCCSTFSEKGLVQLMQ